MKNPWSILWVSFSLGVLGAFVQFAVQPLMPVLQAQFAVSYGDAGLFMSIFAFATLIVASPCGLTIQRYGVKKVGLIGMLLMVVGVALSIVADNYAFFLLSRIVQGVGFAMVAVSAPSAIGQFIPRPMMPIAMGIWSMWIPFGGLVMFFSASRILEFFSISAYWILLLIVLIPGIIALLIVIPSHEQAKAAGLESGPTLSSEIILDEIKNPHIWLPALAFAAHTWGVFSFSTWSTSFLTEELSLTMVEASYVTIIFWITSALSNIYGALIIRKFAHKLWPYVLPPLLTGCLWPVCSIHNIASFYAAATLIGLISGIMPTIIFLSAPLWAKRAAGIGVAMSIVIIGENLGIVSGPGIFGFMRQLTGGYTISFCMLSIGSLVQIFCFYKIWRTGSLVVTHQPAKTEA